MSTFFWILGGIALVVAGFALFAPQQVLAWLAPVHWARARTVGMYFLLALFLGLIAKLAMPPENETLVELDASAFNATAFNATSGPTLPVVGNATLQTGEGSGVSGGNSGLDGRPPQTNSSSVGQDKTFMDNAQETITRAANATREFGRNVADEAGQIGGELVDGASEAGQQLLDSAKETKDELLNNK